MVDLAEGVKVRIGEEATKWSKTFSWAEPLSPTAAPKAWILINGVCCLATAAFFALAWMPLDSQAYHLAEAYYVPFNMLVCLLWMAEAALWMLFDQGESIWQKTGELALAAYFIFDGLVYCYEWAILGTLPQAQDILFYSSIDVAMYLYYFLIAAEPEILSHLTSWIPSDPRETLETPSYKYAISSCRRLLVWWLPMAVTLMWLRKHYTQTWDASMEIALFSAGIK